MSESIAALIVVVIATAVTFWLRRQQTRRVDDAQLSEWEEFLIKGNREQPKKKPVVTTSELSASAYDQIEKLWNPKLRREFNERSLSLRNEVCARAIQLEKVSRRMAEGKPLSDFDDSILIREKLRNGDSKSTADSEPMEFTPGRKFDDSLARTTTDESQSE